MPTTTILLPFETLKGCSLKASDGEIGRVREFFFDDSQWMVRYFVVETGSWFTGRTVLISPASVKSVDPQTGVMAVNLTKEQIKTAPHEDTNKPVSRQYEDRLSSHYQWPSPWLVPGAAGGTMLARSESPSAAEERQPAAVPRAEGDPHLRSSEKLIGGYKLHTQDGEVGRVKDFIVDDSNWRVRYLVIHDSIWTMGKEVLLSPEWIERIANEKSEVFVNLPASAIKQAPDYNSSVPISRAYEQSLHDHYGRRGYWDEVEKSRTSKAHAVR